MRSLRALIPALLLLALSGCATWGPGGAPHRHREGYSVTIPAGWIFHPSMGGELLATRDGLVLQRLTIRHLKLPHTLPLSKRELTAALTPYELAEIFTDEGKADRTLSQFAVSQQSAVKIGRCDGVRFDFSYATQDGLRLSGRRWLVKRDGDLWLAAYLAPTRYYYERDLPAVSAAVEAITFDPAAR